MNQYQFRQWMSSVKRFHFWGFGIDETTFVAPLVGVKELSQLFSGFIDKLGAKIFEGDLMIHPDFKPVEILEVKFENGVFTIGGYDCVRTDFKKGTVIGNIFDNPTLVPSDVTKRPKCDLCHYKGDDRGVCRNCSNGSNYIRS